MSTLVSVVVVHVVFSEMHNVVLAVACRSENHKPYVYTNHDISTLAGVYVTAPFIATNVVSVCLILLTAVFANPRANPRQDVVYARRCILVDTTAPRTAAAAAA